MDQKCFEIETIGWIKTDSQKVEILDDFLSAFVKPVDPVIGRSVKIETRYNLAREIYFRFLSGALIYNLWKRSSFDVKLSKVVL